MHQPYPKRDTVLSRRAISPMTVAASLFFITACQDNDALHRADSGGSRVIVDAVAGYGGASAPSVAGTSESGAGKRGVAGSAGSVAAENSGGNAGTAGSNEIAGGGEDVGGAGSGGIGNAGSGGVSVSAGSGGIDSAGSGGVSVSAGAGGSEPTSHCATGGALFAEGSYVDVAGNRFILKVAQKATTFALVPAGVANPSKPPQLFLVDRVCAPGGALIARDATSSYRLDFVQSGTQLGVCVSPPAASLEAALLLSAADTTHALDSGCSGHAFSIYAKEGS